MSMNQIKLAIGVLALVMICIFGYSYFNGLNSNIVSTETRLTALYKGNQVELGQLRQEDRGSHRHCQRQERQAAAGPA
jgi:hypothetical protein